MLNVSIFWNSLKGFSDGELATKTWTLDLFKIWIYLCIRVPFHSNENSIFPTAGMWVGETLSGNSMGSSGTECGVLSGRNTWNSEQKERRVEASESPRIKG